MSNTSKALFSLTSEPTQTNPGKVTVVGVGAVGMACVTSLLMQGITKEICLIDVMEDRLKGEMMDLQHGALFLQNPKIQAGKDIRTSAGSKLIIITAGVRQAEGESRLNLVQRNVEIFKHSVPALVQHSPNAIILVVSNPCDILTYVVWKLSRLPVNRVVGAGTNLDTARFRFMLAQKLGVSTTSVHGWIIGEHGDSSVAVWSGVNIAGVRLQEICPSIGGDDDVEGWKKVHKDVVDSAYKIIKCKGFTNWAIGLSTASIALSILTNDHKVHAVSVMLKGRHGFDYEVFTSLPSVVGANGVEKVVIQPLSANERCALKFSAALISEVQGGLKLA